MAQAGIHGLVSLVVKKWIPGKEWLVLGIVLGSILPDADNLVVAVATVAKLPTLWTITQAVFLVIFSVLVYIMSKGFMTIYGVFYLLSLGLVVGITIRMRKTIEAAI